MDTNILIVDDHKMFGEGLSLLIKESSNYNVIGTLTVGSDVISYLNALTVDVLFLDIDLPDISGIELAKKLRIEFPLLHIIMLSMHNRPEFFKEFYEMGIAGYIVKNAGKDEILKAIKTVVSGQKYYSDEIINNFLSASASNQSKSKAIITGREREILKLVVQGKSTHEISDALFISKHTVDTHRKNLLSKLNVKNTAELVQVAINEGFI